MVMVGVNILYPSFAIWRNDDVVMLADSKGILWYDPEPHWCLWCGEVLSEDNFDKNFDKGHPGICIRCHLTRREDIPRFFLQEDFERQNLNHSTFIIDAGSLNHDISIVDSGSQSRAKFNYMLGKLTDGDYLIFNASNYDVSLTGSTKIAERICGVINRRADQALRGLSPDRKAHKRKPEIENDVIGELTEESFMYYKTEGPWMEN